MNLSDEEREALWDQIEEMQSKMQTAIDEEHYEEAATLRDSIKELKIKDPYAKAEIELEQAVKEEKYEDAARLRAEMKEAGKPPLRRKRDDASALQGILAGEGASVGELTGIKPYSETVTRGTRISVNSFYVPEPSAPKDGRFMFGYVRVGVGCCLAARACEEDRDSAGPLLSGVSITIARCYSSLHRPITGGWLDLWWLAYLRHPPHAAAA